MFFSFGIETAWLCGCLVEFFLWCTMPAVVATPPPPRLPLDATPQLPLPLASLVWSARVALGACVGRGKRSPSKNIRPQGCRPPFSRKYYLPGTRRRTVPGIISLTSGALALFWSYRVFCHEKNIVPTTPCACFDLRLLCMNMSSSLFLPFLPLDSYCVCLRATPPRLTPLFGVEGRGRGCRWSSCSG